MKKLILLGMAILSIGAFAAREDIPEDVEKMIIKSSQTLDGSEKIRYKNWQIDSYLRMEKLGKESGIPTNEFERIKHKLRVMYGANFAKQYQVLPDEIRDYNELVARVKRETAKNLEVSEEKNSIAKAEMEKNISVSQVPAEVIEIYKETAEKLYPENYVGQKAYIDASMEEYFKIIEFIKNNKNLIK